MEPWFSMHEYGKGKMEEDVKKMMLDSACVVSNSRRFAYPIYVPLLWS
jgi:hypothetical protein